MGSSGGLVAIVGVQSNQYPRAMDIARKLRAKGIQVSIGGFHVSGTISMLKERDPDVQRAEDMGVSLFAGEAEAHTDGFLRQLPFRSKDLTWETLNEKGFVEWLGDQYPANGELTKPFDEFRAVRGRAGNPEIARQVSLNL